MVSLDPATRSYARSANKMCLDRGHAVSVPNAAVQNRPGCSDLSEGGQPFSKASRRRFTRISARALCTEGDDANEGLSIHFLVYACSRVAGCGTLAMNAQ